jgi:hypothetical protein
MVALLGSVIDKLYYLSVIDKQLDTDNIRFD